MKPFYYGSTSLAQNLPDTFDADTRASVILTFCNNPVFIGIFLVLSNDVWNATQIHWPLLSATYFISIVLITSGVLSAGLIWAWTYVRLPKCEMCIKPFAPEDVKIIVATKN
jgi:hypothetical protein